MHELFTPLQLDAEEVALRKRFLEFGAQDVDVLKALSLKLDGEAEFFVEDFYAHLLAFRETAQFLEGDGRLEQLKKTQTAYFRSLLAGDYGEDYVRDRIRIGVAHDRAGLEPQWYMGAYSKYLALMLPKVFRLPGAADESKLNAALALLKIVFFDLSLAIDAYIHSNEQAIRDKAAQLAALNMVAIAISSSLGLQDVLTKIMQQGIELTGSKAACVAFYNQDTGLFEEWHTQGLSDPFVSRMSFRPGGLADETFKTGNYVLSNGRPGAPHPLSRLARGEGLQCFICLPLTSHSYPMGVLYFYRTDRDVFLPEEINLLTTFANLAAGAIHNARLHAQTQDMATTDALTDLYNRRALDARLECEILRSQRYSKPFSLMMLDIDHFKKVNDTHGHAAGDSVLRQLGALLIDETRDVDIVARYGGEEFVITLPETTIEPAKQVAERIRSRIADAPFTLPHGETIHLTISIGVSCFPNAAAAKSEEILERADRALYIAKRLGRNRVSTLI